MSWAFGKYASWLNMKINATVMEKCKYKVAAGTQLAQHILKTRNLGKQLAWVLPVVFLLKVTY